MKWWKIRFSLSFGSFLKHKNYHCYIFLYLQVWFSIALSIYIALLILFIYSLTCFWDTLCSCFVKQDKSEDKENYTRIEMHELQFSGMLFITVISFMLHYICILIWCMCISCITILPFWPGMREGSFMYLQACPNAFMSGNIPTIYSRGLIIECLLQWYIWHDQ